MDFYSLQRDVNPPALDLRSMPTANILIIDDDVDAALLVEQVFVHLGCQTTCSLTPVEARKRICAGKSDVIILDWCLDHHVNASSILQHCIRTFQKFGVANNKPKPRVVTYSGLSAGEIEFVQSPYFEYLGHWQKPISRPQLLSRVLTLLDKVEHHERRSV